MLNDPGYPLAFIYENCQIFFSFYRRPNLRVANKPQVLGKKEMLVVFTQKEGLAISKRQKGLPAMSKFPSLGDIICGETEWADQMAEPLLQRGPYGSGGIILPSWIALCIFLFKELNRTLGRILPLFNSSTNSILARTC